jgi:transcription elongation factor Elf1
MAKIAHLKVTCPKCGKYSSIYVEEGGSSAKVKCEHCKQIFEFGRGMMYEPIAYVPSIPSWAMISKAEEANVFSLAAKCGKCGYEYTKDDSSLHGVFSETASKSESPVSAMLLNNPALKSLLGVKVLYKCSSCSKTACSECALESDGITRKKCPFCKSDYTIYSEINPAGADL